MEQQYRSTINADQSDVDVQSLREEMYPQIARHEGVRNKAYYDSEGKLTIGIGFNLDDKSNQAKLEKLGYSREEFEKGKKLSDEEIKELYNQSWMTAYQDAVTWLPNFNDHPKEVQKAVIDMAFNLGRPTLEQFVKAKQGFLNMDYNKAADEMLDSKWATQVKGRAVNLANMVRTSKR